MRLAIYCHQGKTRYQDLRARARPKESRQNFDPIERRRGHLYGRRDISALDLARLCTHEQRRQRAGEMALMCTNYSIGVQRVEEKYRVRVDVGTPAGGIIYSEWWTKGR
jgi:hypothetical protein